MDIDGAVRRLVVRECSVDATAKVLEVGEVGGFATLARLEVRVGKRPDSAIAKGDGGVYSRPTRKMGRLSAVVDARMMAIMRKKWMGRSGWAGPIARWSRRALSCCTNANEPTDSTRH
jgi:hypothetical protein